MNQSTNELRKAFLDFFGERQHEVVKSGPLVLPNDPTLVFANAGMVQFKDVFTGRETRSYSRATSSQKCIRIKGKHNDLEAVGPSPRHHTFFEMLGNFSFGDYFKEEAIVYAWDFLVKVLGLPTDRMVCTYFKGEGEIPADETARDLWKKVSGLPESRILGLGTEDNFWSMGDVGPCGPCSEIYWYNGKEVNLDRFGEEQTPQGEGWMEIWNLVFMQFERRRLEDGGIETTALPKPSIDTGAGLERLACAVQGHMSNYEIDLLRGLVDLVAEISGKPYRGTMDPDDVSMRVIADHARSTAFLMAEGVLPERTEKEYVLRRVMRRAIRHGHRLGIEELFLHRVASKVADLMGDQYPELVERKELIESVSQGEEERFRQTIERGLTLLDERFERFETADAKVLPGDDVFQLYDTYGFPPDLTEVICAERGFTADMEGYEAKLAEAQAKSKFKPQGELVDDVFLKALESVPKKEVRFTGYERDQDQSRVAYLIVDGTSVEQAEAGQEVIVITESTPFYGEAGGQVGDQGRIESGAARVVVRDTKKPVAGAIVHHAAVESGTLRVGDAVTLAVDAARRDDTRKNHSATHLLHWALRKVLGAHAQQKGSLVGPERLRFDFTHNSPLSSEQIAEIEDLVNGQVLANTPVRTELLSMDEARERGAMMIFEEKYGDVVRLLRIGESTELCGGTHARATGDIGLFKITSEQGVAAGVRRILASTGLGTLQHLRDLDGRLAQAAAAAKTNPAALVEKIEKLLEKQRAYQKEVDDLQKQLSTGGGSGTTSDLLSQVQEVSGVKVLGVKTVVTDRAALRELAEQLRDQLGESIVLVASESGGKAQLVLTVTKSLNDRFKAGELIRPVASVVGGSGGGRPDMAQAGGTEAAKLDDAVRAIYDTVRAASTPS